MEYTLIRSARKTVALQMKNGVLTVRAPLRMPLAEIRAFIDSKRDWIEKHRREQTAPKPPVAVLSPEEIRALARKAAQVIPPRTARYADIIGVRYSRIAIRLQRSRWGSCSSKGTLSFNCLLMLVPEDVLDASIVHELCHLRHPDHSRAFYGEVYRYYPGYDAANAWLKQNGPALLRRAFPDR